MFSDKGMFFNKAGFFNEAGVPGRMGRKVGSTWNILAPAKLNLYLEVLGSRADGFHALETLMVPVRVYDQLFWQGVDTSSSGKGLTLRVRNLLPVASRSDQLLEDLSDNLVLRAARLLAKTAGIVPSGRFDLIKRIPLQAGMGGGSSDAAATLMLANAAWEIGYSQSQLMPLAAQLGSDVPFFLARYFRSRGAAICRGRGELVEPVNRLPQLHFVVAKPEAGLSTAEVFGHLPVRTETSDELTALSHARLSGLISALQSGAIASAACKMTNRLETAAARLAPWLAAMREIFSKTGCVGHFMTGSGSAYVGVMRSATQARRAARRLATINLEAGNLEVENLKDRLKMGSVFATSSC
ncbi:MAG: 4-(cytidine 5'-diphospho)-2-C-methyl-D-erythritol kinase [Planctomycetes bacterium]|nr:4-(cytidine 5'-diphospho)-2-C-methyl-D-erythritol kinase [Planctomycetota bacterium]